MSYSNKFYSSQAPDLGGLDKIGGFCAAIG